MNAVFSGIELRDDIPILLNRLGLEGKGIEIGTQAGLYAQVLLGGSMLRKLCLVDCWDLVEENDRFRNDSAYSHEKLRELKRKAEERFRCEPRVEIVQSFAHEFSATVESESLDFVYLDAAHDEESVAQDLQDWYPKLRKGGVFAGHDYLNNEPWAPTYVKFGVIEAVSKFRMRIPDHEFYTTPEMIPSWMLIKP
jgi:hypothetical protein